MKNFSSAAARQTAAPTAPDMRCGSVTLALPVPPSTNNLFINVRGRGRIKSQRYRDWVLEAHSWLKQQTCGVVIGAYLVEITLPEMIRGDIDNRIKPISDFLVTEGVTPDDKYMWKVSVERNPNVPPGECHVTARSIKTARAA
jgi:crossover junction endodeoxyribonuclease RusA